jgi:hypothetical protein
MRGDVRTTTRVSPGRQLSVCDRCAILTSARGSKLVQEEGRSNAEARLVVASRATVTSGKVVSSRVLRRVRYRQVVAQRDTLGLVNPLCRGSSRDRRCLRQWGGDELRDR